jgi:Ca-activated chloride channel family protein
MFELATPWILIGLPLPWLIWRYAPKATMEPQQALHIPFFDMISTLDKAKITQQSRPSFWLMGVWVLMILALAGPRWVGNPEQLSREGHNILLALDISGSMAIDDMTWQGQSSTRLNVVKHAANAFVRHRENDKIGLILFGTHAYLQTPLTHDKQTVLLRLDDATVGLAGQTTALGDPIGLAIKHLQHAPQQGRIMILLTDGASNAGVISPLKAADIAKKENIKIYTIGLGADTSMNPMTRLSIGFARGTDLDEDTLKTIAKTTGGHYFRATDETSLQRIYQLINQMETVKQEDTAIRPQHDYYPWPLAIALLLLIVGVLHERGALGRLMQHQPRRVKS